jgi:hypothetical protein
MVNIVLQVGFKHYTLVSLMERKHKAEACAFRNKQGVTSLLGATHLFSKLFLFIDF